MLTNCFTGGANKVYFGRYANWELHLKVLHYYTVWLAEKYRHIHQSEAEARAAAKHTRASRQLDAFAPSLTCSQSVYKSHYNEQVIMKIL